MVLREVTLMDGLAASGLYQCSFQLSLASLAWLFTNGPNVRVQQVTPMKPTIAHQYHATVPDAPTRCPPSSCVTLILSAFNSPRLKTQFCADPFSRRAVLDRRSLESHRCQRRRDLDRPDQFWRKTLLAGVWELSPICSCIDGCE